jgi:hypothetical protein
MAGSVADISVYQLVQVAPGRRIIDRTPRQIAESPSQNDDTRLTLSAQSRQAALTPSSLSLEDTWSRQSGDAANDTAAWTSRKMFAYPSRVYQALRAYAQSAELNETTKHRISIYV